MAPTCIHDGTKMLSNPITNGEPFWCPRCGQHEYRSSNGNGHRKPVVAVSEPAECICIDYPDGRQRTCPTCRDRARAAAIQF